MEVLDKANNNSVKHSTIIASDSQKNMCSLVNYVILCGVLSLFGSAANVINMIVFYRQGLDTTINISFFSLAVSDLFSLILQQWFNIYVNPLFVGLNLPIVYSDYQFLIPGLTREMFARITCLITAFITAERCMCVVFPLHVKQIITPRRTKIIIVVIFVSSLLSPVPIYATSYYDWKFYPDLNATLLGLVFTEYNGIMVAFAYLTHAVFTLVGFMSVVTFTLILIYKLGQKSAWRQTANVDLDKSKSMSRRDRGTITMVVLIAGILVVCYTPATLLGLGTFIEPELSVTGIYYNLYYIFWSVALVCENINSSVNIFLYYRMSSKYRQTFRGLFIRGVQSGHNQIPKPELTG